MTRTVDAETARVIATEVGQLDDPSTVLYAEVCANLTPLSVIQGGEVENSLSVLGHKNGVQLISEAPSLALCIVATPNGPAYEKRTTDSTRPFFDPSNYGYGKASPQFVFMHEFMHLVDSNNRIMRQTSTGEYINRYMQGQSNQLPGERHADQLTRDLLNRKCPCD